MVEFILFHWGKRKQGQALSKIINITTRGKITSLKETWQAYPQRLHTTLLKAMGGTFTQRDLHVAKATLSWLVNTPLTLGLALPTQNLHVPWKGRHFGGHWGAQMPSVPQLGVIFV